MGKALIGVAVTGALGVLAFAPAVHADPNSYFLDCLQQHKVTGSTDPDQAEGLGSLVQAEETKGWAPQSILADLEANFGLNPATARDYMGCAAATLDNSGNLLDTGGK